MSQRTMEPSGHPQVTRTSAATGRRTRARGGWAPVPTGTVDGLSSEQHAMERRKRRVYAVTLLAAALALGTSWLTREPGDVVLAYAYPLTGLLLVALTVAMLRRRLTLRTFEAIAYGMMAVLILGRLAWHLHLAGPIEEHLLVLVGGHYWAVGVLLVAGFVLLDRRRGLIGGVVVITTSVVLVVTGAGADLLGADGTRVELLYLARVHAFLVLLLALSMAVATVREQLHRSLAGAEAFEELAATDQLTGLANRRAALEVLGRELRAQGRYGRPVTVVLADIDHFKRINDAHGHSVGDRVLCEVAAELRRHARDADVVARWGGEESSSSPSRWMRTARRPSRSGAGRRSVRSCPRVCR